MRCKGLPAYNEIALGFGIDVNKGFHLDARVVSAGGHI